MIVERSYVINLDRRPDRLRKFFLDFPAELPAPERFSATDWRMSKIPDAMHYLPPWGCWDSHRRILMQCVQEGVQSVLIFEDDAQKRQGFSSLWHGFQNNLPADWQFVFLGGNPKTGKSCKAVNDHIMVPHGVRTTHAYMVREPFLSKLTAAVQPPRSWDHIDMFYEAWIPGNCQSGYYGPSRWLFGQSASASDIAQVMEDDRMFPDLIEMRDVRFVPRPQPCDWDENHKCRRKRCGLIGSSICKVGNGLMDVTA